MKRFFVYGFALLLAITGVSVFAGGDRSFSENENRYLTILGDVTSAKVLSGDFQKELTAYGSDQIPGRDNYMEASTLLKKMTGREDIGNVYLGKEGFYFEKKLDKDIDFNRYGKNLEKVERIASAYGEKNVSLMLVPESGNVYPELLPKDAKIFNHEKMYEEASRTLEKCRLVNPQEALVANKPDQLYYRTDHHWTQAGAYAGYKAFMGKDCKLERKQVSDSFLGTLYSKVLDEKARKPVNEGGSLDTIEIPIIDERIKVTADGSEIPIFDRKALKEKDQYKVYFGGNYGIVNIKGQQVTGSGEGTGAESGAGGSTSKGKRLVIIKDSFANCFAPLLVNDYSEITMIDLRYFAGNPKEVLEGADDILFLYQLSNFAGDSNLVKLML